MMNGRKTSPDVGDVELPQLPELKPTNETPQMCIAPQRTPRRKYDVLYFILRIGCLISSVISLALMVSARESATADIFGLTLPLDSQWSYSQSFRYVVGVTAAVTVHSALQLMVSISKLMRKSPIISSRRHAWLIFAADQVFAFLTMSAGSAASGVTNLNRTGIKHSALPNFCKSLPHFCNRIAVSIGFTFLGCILLVGSVVLNVMWLSKY